MPPLWLWQFAQNQGPETPGVARGNQAACIKDYYGKGRAGHCQNRGNVFRGFGLVLGKHVQNQFGIGSCLKQGASRRQIFAQGLALAEVSVMAQSYFHVHVRGE